MDKVQPCHTNASFLKELNESCKDYFDKLSHKNKIIGQYEEQTRQFVD